MNIQLNNLQLSFTNLPKELDGLTVLHLSDLHIKKTGLLEQRAKKIISENHYDICVISGDLTTRANWVEHIREMLGTYDIDRPVYVVPGNSEHKSWVNTSDIVSAFNKHEFITLINDSITFEKNGKKITVVGMDDGYSRLHDVEKAFSEVKPDAFIVALSPCPSLTDKLINKNASLILCGHTHGGQIRFPGLGVIWSHMHKNKFLNDGLYLPEKLSKLLNMDIKESVLYVNRGLGTSRLHIRLNCRPEIAYITLRYSNKKSEL